MFLNDVGSGDIGRHEVRRELNPVETKMHGFGDTGNEKGFGQSGNSHEETVASGEEADGKLFDDFFLTDDDFSELRFEGLVFFAELVDCRDVISREWVIV